MQNNSYWSSQNQHLTHEGLLHAVKLGVWRAASEERIVGFVCFNETVNCEGYLQAILSQMFSELTEEGRLYS
jgi:hypothetical protein